MFQEKCTLVLQVIMVVLALGIFILLVSRPNYMYPPMAYNMPGAQGAPSNTMKPESIEVPVKFKTEPISLDITLSIDTKFNNPEPISIDVNTNVNSKPVNVDVVVDHKSKKILVPIALSFEELKDKYGEEIPKPKSKSEELPKPKN